MVKPDNKKIQKHTVNYCRRQKKKKKNPNKHTSRTLPTTDLKHAIMHASAHTTTTTTTTYSQTDAHAWSCSFIMALCQRVTDVSQRRHLFLSPASPRLSKQQPETKDGKQQRGDKHINQPPNQSACSSTPQSGISYSLIPTGR